MFFENCGNSTSQPKKGGDGLGCRRYPEVDERLTVVKLMPKHPFDLFAEFLQESC